MELLVTPVIVDLPTQELTVGFCPAIFEFTLAMVVIYKIKMDGGMTVTHTLRSLQSMPMATHSERGHQLRVVIRAQTGMNGWILDREHGGISKSVSMMMTIMQMMHCLIKLLGPYFHVGHTLM